MTSENGFDAFGSLTEWFSALATEAGLSEFEVSATLLADSDESTLFSPLLESLAGLELSKFNFCEKDDSLVVFGGDCDLCDGESGAVRESSSTFEMIPCA